PGRVSVSPSTSVPGAVVGAAETVPAVPASAAGPVAPVPAVSAPTSGPAAGSTVGVTVAGAVVVVVVEEVVVGAGAPPEPWWPRPSFGRPQLPLLSSSRSASLPQPLLPSRSESNPPVQPGLSAPPLLIPSGSECDRPWVWPVAVKQVLSALFTPWPPDGLAPAGVPAANSPMASRAPAPVTPIRPMVPRILLPPGSGSPLTRLEA